MKCAECRFFVSGRNECRRFPPTPVYNASLLEMRAYFPVLSINDWCGEFKEKSDTIDAMIDALTKEKPV